MVRRMGNGEFFSILLKGLVLFFKSLVSGEKLPNPRMPSVIRMLILMVIAASLFNAAFIAWLAQPCDPKESLCPPELQAGFGDRFLHVAASFAPLLLGAYAVGFIAILMMIGAGGEYRTPEEQSK